MHISIQRIDFINILQRLNIIRTKVYYGGSHWPSSFRDIKQ